MSEVLHLPRAVQGQGRRVTTTRATHMIISDNARFSVHCRARKALTATAAIRSAAVYAGTVSATVLARTSVGPSGVSYLRRYGPSGSLLIDESFQFNLGFHKAKVRGAAVWNAGDSRQ